jgi:hypothetical protein
MFTAHKLADGPGTCFLCLKRNTEKVGDIPPANLLFAGGIIF